MFRKTFLSRWFPRKSVKALPRLAQLRLEELESRWLPSANIGLIGPSSTGGNAIDPAVVDLQVNGQLVITPTPFPGFAGGITVAVGDVNGDGTPDWIFGEGAGLGPRVRIFSGKDEAVLADFFAFTPGFSGGVTVAVGDVNGDGKADIIVGAGQGGVPEVKVIDGTKVNQVQANGEIADTAVLADFFAFAPGFAGGVNVAAGDVNFDGKADIIVGAGPGDIGPHVEVVDGTKVNQVLANGTIADTALLADFFGFAPSFTGGVTVAAGDVSGDGKADVILGAGPGGGPEVKVVDGTKVNQVLANGTIADTALLANFFAFAPNSTGGVTVAAHDVNADNKDDILVGSGPGVGAQVKVVDGTKVNQVLANGTIADTALLDNFSPFGASFSGGVNVAADPTIVFTRADVTVTSLTGLPNPVPAGTNLTYTIGFANNGPNDAIFVTVTDAVPAGTTLVSATPAAGWARTDLVPAGGTGNIVFSKASVTADDSASFQIVVQVAATTTAGSGVISDTATAFTATIDPTSSNDSKTTTTDVSPVVTTSNTSLPADAATIVINGAGFDPSADNNSVTFNDGATGIILAGNASATALTVTFITKPTTAGSLTAIVKTGGQNSGTPIQVATVRPVVTPNSATLANSAATIVISGVGFDPTPGNNIAVFNDSAAGTVTAASATSITVTFTAAPVNAGNLTAVVTTNGVSSGAAAQVATVTTPTLSITQTDSGNFFRGEIGATFTITVTNTDVSSTGGTINLADGLPGGLSATAFAGTGWTVDLIHFTATSSDAIAAGASYPTLTLTVNVDNNAPNNLTNFVTVSGGDAPNVAAASDPGTIGAPPLTITQTDSGNFFKGKIDASFTIIVTNNGATPIGGTTTVVDHVPGGLTATAFAGTGWTVDFAHFTATRTDTLAAGESFPPLILTVNVDNSALSSLTNFVTLSGAGLLNVNAVNDTVAIAAPAVSVTAIHSGNFSRGQVGAIYSISVSNTGNVAISDAVSLVDELPGDFTAVSFAGNGWNVDLSTFTATRSDPLPAGQSFPTLTLSVNVSAGARPLVTNSVKVTVKDIVATANDTTTII
jgi:uncharacterized repeat protein (TIGR01451 family)